MYKGFLVWTALGCAAVAGSLPDAHEIITRSVKVAEANWLEAPHYSCIRSDAKSKNGAPAVKKTYQVMMIEGSPYMKVIAEDGRPLSAARAQEEEQKLQKETAKRANESPRERRKRVEAYTEDRNRDHAMLSELSEAFDYTVTGEQQSGGTTVWVLEGKQRPAYVPRTREAKVLSGMNVKFWIDKETYQWLRVEAEVKQPVTLYGAIAKVGPGTKFMLEQEPVYEGIWLPKHFSMKINASALGFIHEDSVQDETYTNYRFAAPTVNTAAETSATEKANAGLQ